MKYALSKEELKLTPTFSGIYKTTEYLRMKGVLDSIELQMLRRADYMRECNILRESHVHSYKTQSARVNGWELGEQIVCSP